MVSKYYQALDLYLITSRDEGGPKAILESMASGIPLISTDVGMAQDVIENGKNGYLVDIEDIEAIVQYSKKIIDNPQNTSKMIENSLETVKKYCWENIATHYYREMYSKLLVSR